MSWIGKKMGEVRSPEEEEKVESRETPIHRQYSIFSVEEDEEGINLLNFSEDSSYFPDYVAERALVGDGEEFWTVNTEEDPLEEVSVDSDYDGKYELASRLQEAYDEIIR